MVTRPRGLSASSRSCRCSRAFRRCIGTPVNRASRCRRCQIPVRPTPGVHLYGERPYTHLDDRLIICPVSSRFNPLAARLLCTRAFTHYGGTCLAPLLVPDGVANRSSRGNCRRGSCWSAVRLP